MDKNILGVGSKRAKILKGWILVSSKNIGGVKWIENNFEWWRSVQKKFLDVVFLQAHCHLKNPPHRRHAKKKEGGTGGKKCDWETCIVGKGGKSDILSWCRVGQRKISVFKSGLIDLCKWEKVEF